MQNRSAQGDDSSSLVTQDDPLGGKASELWDNPSPPVTKDTPLGENALAGGKLFQAVGNISLTPPACNSLPPVSIAVAASSQRPA